MKIDFLDVFVSLNIIFLLFDLLLSAFCFKDRTNNRRIFAVALYFAASAIVSYIITIYVRDYFWFSLCSSLYFLSIDWCLAFFFYFSCLLIRKQNDKYLNMMIKVYFAYAIIDTIICLINPFYEISISYIPRDTIVSVFAYNKMLLFSVHLFMSYVILFSIIMTYVHKVVSVPEEYRNQYLIIVVGILTIVFINALFLFIPGDNIYNILDTSIVAYSIVAYFIYFGAYTYSKDYLLKDLSEEIVNRSNQGIMLFDYDNELILENRKAKELIRNSDLNIGTSLDEFFYLTGISEKVIEKNEYSFQYIVNDGAGETLRCDYMLLKNVSGRMLGHLFTFVDVSRETDMLTGFFNYEDFKKFYYENTNRFEPPYLILEMDITNLAAINTNLGKDTGDKKIAELAELMKKYLPDETYFVRGVEANLIAITPSGKQRISHAVEMMEKEFSRFFHYTIIVTDEKESNIIDAVETCTETLNIKKMLDMSSGHSDILVSLIKALQECDSDTEEHVKRTQKMGAQLGVRIGLNDYEMARLSLLCLLHDIGKIGIPLEVLNKPGKLTDEEFALIKTHVEKGYQIAESTKEFRCISDLVKAHHERWDGKGYPLGLGKEEIPLLSRIISVVDAYDAMISDRSYRKGRSSEAALQEIKRCSGSQFDPYIANEFVAMIGGENQDFSDIEIPDLPSFKDVENVVPRDLNHVILNTSLVNYSRYFLDPSMRIVEADYNFENITGYTAEDIKYSVIHQIDLVPEEDRADYLLLVNEALGKHQVAFTQHRLLRKDGKMVKVMCVGRVYYDSVSKEEKSEIFICEI